MHYLYLMRRALAVYVLLLDFFVLLIGIMYFILNLRDPQAVEWGFMLSGPLLILCPVCSFFYFLGMRNTSVPAPTEPLKGILDAVPDESPSQSYALATKAYGIVSCVFSGWLLIACIRLLYTYYQGGYMDSLSIQKPDITIIPVVLLFNAICQPLYVWKTFRNVKLKK